MGVFARGSKLWIRFRGSNGKWRNVTTGYELGQEALAREMLAEMHRLVAGEAAGEAPLISKAGRLTVLEYMELWLADRRAIGRDWKHDRSRLQHVMPVLGELAIAEVRTRHLIEAFQRVRTIPSENTGQIVSPRTVHRIYEVVSRMFGDAQLADLITQDPCVLDERHLGALVDKDPEWRAGALFTRDEATALLSTDAIPDDRRMLYAFMLLAGMRPGEASALRWRHYDPTVLPLGRLTVAVAYDSRRHREKSTKTDATRYVPVHATLAAMLAEWKLAGWEALCSRKPEPDDLIIPLPPADAEARRTRDGEPFRTERFNGKQWREIDLPALGWRHRQMYAMKATFITLVLDDGADPHVIETRVTHTKKSRSAFDGYNRGRQWELTCAEVSKLKLARRDVELEAIPIAVGESAVACSDPTLAVATLDRQQPITTSDRLTDRGQGPLVTSLVTAAASARDDLGDLLRRRGSNAHRATLQVISGGQSREVGPADVPCDAPNVTSAVTASVDPIAGELEAATTAWKATRDRTELRRALARLLAEIA
jgi:integrase